ncbi:hypothetical protein [Streptomyces sp. NPDC001714]
MQALVIHHTTLTKSLGPSDTDAPAAVVADAGEGEDRPWARLPG